MTIELWDMDVPYSLSIDCNDEGEDFVRLSPDSTKQDRSDDYDICLSKEQCGELARALMFVANEIK